MPPILWLLACVAPSPEHSEPWAQAEALLAEAPSTWYRIDWGEALVGVEEHREIPMDPGALLWRQRTLALRIDGAVEHRVHTLWAVLGPQGEVRSWRVVDDQGERRGQAGAEPVWLLDRAEVEGRVWALEASGTTRQVTVEQGRWTLDGFAWERDAEGLRSGPLTRRPVDAPPPLPGADPAALMWRPAEVPSHLRVGETAGRARVAVYEVDGERVEVRAPFALELTAEARRRARGWMAQARAAGGDCKAQAAALVERAEAEGVAARVVHGLVWLNGEAGPGLLPHAWAEVALEGRWLPLDPILGQLPADATHLPLSPSEMAEARVVLKEVR